MLRNWLTPLLGAVALALLALPTTARAGDSCSSGCCSTDSCPTESCSRHPDATPSTIEVAHRCYSCKCDEITFPKSKICCNLFHGWKRKYDCASGQCANDCGACAAEAPPAKCGCTYTHKTLVVKIRYEQVPINTCPTCTGDCGPEAAPMMAAPAPTLPKAETVPAPRPAGEQPMPAGK